MASRRIIKVKHSFSNWNRFVVMLLLAAAAVFSSCEQGDVVAPVASEPSNFALTLEKGSNNDNSNDSYNSNNHSYHGTSTLQFPIVVSRTFRYSRKLRGYKGGTLIFSPDGLSSFTLPDKALTPPPGHPERADVTITAVIDYNREADEYTFSFGPHGCQFDPRAEIKLDIRNMEVPTLELYYIEDNGNYLELQPDQIDVNRRWLKIYVDHFSRYALAHGRW